MGTPKIRASRTLRTLKQAKRKGLRAARLIEITRKGLHIEGERLPYYIGRDVDITVLPGKPPAHLVNVTVFADRVKVTDPPRGANVTYHYE